MGEALCHNHSKLMVQAYRESSNLVGNLKMNKYIVRGGGVGGSNASSFIITSLFRGGGGELLKERILYFKSMAYFSVG